MNTRTISVTELDALFQRFAAAIESARARAHQGVDQQFDLIATQQAADYATLRKAAEAGELFAPADFAETQALAERGNASLQ